MTDSQQDMQKQEAGVTAPDGDAPKKVNVALRVYGVLMMLMGILDMVVFLFTGALLGLALYFSTMSPELAGMFNALLAEALGDQTTLAAECKDARRAEQLENEQDAAAGMDGREVREHDNRAAELHALGQRAEGGHEREGRRRRARGGCERRRRGHGCDGGHGNSRDGHRLATEGQGRRGPSGSTPGGPLSYGATARLQVVDLG